MQAELDLLGLPLDVHLLGVNGVGAESGNAAATAGRTIPWLQDTAGVDAWGLWQVEYRDLIILNADGRLIDVFNLTTYDLTTSFDYNTVKDRLIQAAGG